MKIYLNGGIVEESEASIPVMDRGLLFGDGLFETIRAYEGKPFRLDRHLKRLRGGCRELLISGLPEDREIEKAISELYDSNVGQGDAYIRITLTGGPYDGKKTLARPAGPNVFIVVQPYGGYPEEYYRGGMRVVISSIRRNSGSPLSRLKSNNYLDILIAKQEAKDREADDAVMLNGEGCLAEGTTSNLFFVSNGVVYTPDTDCGLLPGITRETVMELCEGLSIPCRTGFFTTEDLLGSGEAFLTVSTGELLPIAAVEDTTIGDACPGPITTRLAEAYRNLVVEELDLK